MTRLVSLALVLAACRGSSTQEPVVADHRTPLPMSAKMALHQKEQMRDHLRAVQEIVAAIGKDDFKAVTVASARIGWSERQATMCKHMGAGAPGFAEAGEHFHKTADTIGVAAGRQDRAGVLAALDATLNTCTSCHETYRQDVADVAAPDPAECSMH
ncbi:MAG: cytochrome c [Kofleriaceae bacterium]